MPLLHIQMLGGLVLTHGHQLITTVNTPRLQALLAYLILHRDSLQLRQHVAFLFWPDSSEDQARTNLRQLLLLLRRALPDASQFLHSDTNVVQWRSDAPFTCDVADFEQLLTQAVEARSLAEARAALQQAVDCYTGALLPGCYDDWLLAERERLRQQFLQALGQLIQLLEETREYATAIRYAQRLLRHDPLHEATYRRLMRLHALNGNRSQALRVYHTCATMLERELGVAPSALTREAYERLLRTTSAETTVAPATRLAATAPLVGRQREYAQLQAIWRRAAQGHAQFVCLMGEAGIGKTRLAEELFAWAAQQGISAAKTRCYAAVGQLAYAPVADWLRTNAFQSELVRLDAVWLTEVARLLPELLTARPDVPAPQPLAESWQRQRLFAALAHATLAARQPLLLVIDDLQWCDQETLDWLDYLLHHETSARLLVVSTARIELLNPSHPLQALLASLRRSEQVTEILLEPLDAAGTNQLAAHVAERALDEQEALHLYNETEGNPLFIVEMVRALVSGETAPSHPQTDAASLAASEQTTLPPQIQRVIEYRLSQFSPTAHELVGLAATIGRAFTLEILGHASPLDEDVLVRSLDELWQRRIVREHGDFYDFSHDKIREVAYTQLSTARRRLLHRRAAHALEQVHANDLDKVSGQVAAHYEHAGMFDDAITWYRRAATWARSMYAFPEMEQHLTRALRLLDMMAVPDRDARELELRIDLGVALVTCYGYAATAVVENYARARSLCERLHGSMSPPVARALGIAYVVRNELRQALEIGETLLRNGEQRADLTLSVEGHYVTGVALFWLGQFNRARVHFEQGIAAYTPASRVLHLAKYGQDPGVTCTSRLALTLWFLGCPDQALHASRIALQAAAEVGHPTSQAHAMVWSLFVHTYRRDVAAAAALVEKTVAFCEQHQLEMWRAMAAILHGWTMCAQGHVADGVTVMRAEMDALAATGARYALPYHALLADWYRRMGDHERGLQLIDEGMAAVAHNGEHCSHAELLQVKGELLLHSGAAMREVEAILQQALAVARQQQTQALELRAAMSLARLWQAHGRHEEARQMLAEVYGWFTEGFDTLDLQEAQALLKALQST